MISNDLEEDDEIRSKILKHSSHTSGEEEEGDGANLEQDHSC